MVKKNTTYGMACDTQNVMTSPQNRLVCEEEEGGHDFVSTILLPKIEKSMAVKIEREERVL